MRKKEFFRTAVAGLTAIAMAVTMLPATGPGRVEAAGEDSMILHWDMTKDADGTLKDLTNNGHQGVISGAAEAKTIDNIDVLDLSGGYVNIPDGTVGADDTELTVNMLVKITKNVPASWMWCLGSSNKRYLYFTGCCSSGQGSKMRGGAGCVPESGGNGWEYETVIEGESALEENEWQNVTVTYKDGGQFIFYKNGEKQASTDLTAGNAGNFKLQDLMAAGDERDGYMGWSFYTGNDPTFTGAVADFRIYNHAMAEGEVKELETEIEGMLESLAQSDFSEKDVKLSVEDCLGGNPTKDEVTTDLTLPSTTKVSIMGKEFDAQVSWKSSNPDAIGTDGKVTRILQNQTVTMTAAVTLNGNTVNKSFDFKVLGTGTPQDFVEADAEAIAILNQDDIRGNLTLPSEGAYGSKITWTSSNEEVISTKANGKIPAGVVTRQAADTKVTLTATVTYETATITQEYPCTVVKAPEAKETTDYLFAYFPYTNTKDERIYFGISEDGLNFKALNDSKFVLESKLGSHGLRDPFIIRSHEGDKFYLIATDLTVAGVTQGDVKYPGQDWGQNQVNGSKSIMVWESTDLVNWSDQRMCKVAVDNAGCTWAPEAYWDDATQQYVVFWASKSGDDNYGKQRVYYATTRDFNTFSKAQVWIEENGSVIDTTVIKVGDYYYRYTKNEDGAVNQYGTPSKRVYCERSKTLTATKWELVHSNSLDVSGGQIEGPCIFKLNSDDVENAKNIVDLKNTTLDADKQISLTGDEVYCLTADQTGSTIFPGLSSDITTGSFGVLGTSKGVEVDGTPLYTMPEPDASHGTIMPITSEEYNNLMLAYNSAYKEEAAPYVEQADSAEKSLKSVTDALFASPVTANLALPKTVEGADVTWESSNEAIVAADGTVKRPAYEDGDASVALIATITVKGSGSVRDQVRRKTYEVKVAKLTGISLSEKVSLEAGKTASLTANILPAGVAGEWTAWNWASSNPAVVAVAGSGKTATLTGKAAGEATVTLTVKDANGNTATASSKVTVTAAQSHTVKFDSKGGTSVKAQTVKDGGKAVAPKNPKRSKYAFAGWYLGSNKYKFGTAVTKDITLTAKWTKVSVAASKVTAAKNNKSKQCAVTVKKVKGANGYRIAYSTDKKVKKNVKYATAKSNKITLKKLKKGKTYYIKAQAYKVDSKGAKVYGKLSGAKKVVIRK